MREGWPVALPRFTRRPSDSRIRWSPGGAVAVDHVHLRLHFLPLPVAAHEGGVDLVVEVADVAHHGAALQRRQHVAVADVHVAGGGDHEVGLRQQLAVDALGAAVVAPVEVGRHHFVAVHAGLHRADRVDLADAHDHAFLAQRLRRALAHVAVADHQRLLAGQQVVGAALDRVVQAVAAAVLVVVLRLGDRVVHVDRRHLQRAVLEHFLQAQHAGGGLFGDAVHVVQQLRVAFVQDAGEVAAVIEDHVHRPRLAVFQDGLLDAPLVLFLGLALPRVDRDARSGDRRGGVVLRREDVAGGPAHFGAEFRQRLDQHGGLDRHVQAAEDLRAGQRLAVAVARADRHQRRHFALGDRDLATPPAGQRYVGHFVVGECFLCGGHLSVPLNIVESVICCCPCGSGVADRALQPDERVRRSRRTRDIRPSGMCDLHVAHRTRCRSAYVKAPSPAPRPCRYAPR